jgi:aspartate carbamoyltransferase regulatory subunit
MLKIDGMTTGIVIDHIKAGLGVRIFNYLGLDRADFTVALIMNAPSTKLGRKDMIKVENVMHMDYTVLGLIDPNVTIDIIEDGVVKNKIKLSLPEKVENVIKCKNPRCITSIERHVPNIFYLVNEESGEYRCQYCDEMYTFEEA